MEGPISKKGCPWTVCVPEHPATLPGVGSLILSLSVELETLMREGRAYPWPRPPCCPRCEGRRVWGHGYVRRYFDGLSEALMLKRWRCADCGAVHTVRPASHWRGFWAAMALIVLSIQAKLSGARWLAEVSRQRQQYWWHGYQRQSHFAGTPRPLSLMLDQGVIVATHSVRFRCLRALPYDPYRIFAVTAPSGVS
jgi:hypothetical protein